MQLVTKAVQQAITISTSPHSAADIASQFSLPLIAWDTAAAAGGLAAVVVAGAGGSTPSSSSSRSSSELSAVCCVLSAALEASVSLGCITTGADAAAIRVLVERVGRGGGYDGGEGGGGDGGGRISDRGGGARISLMDDAKQVEI